MKNHKKFFIFYISLLVFENSYCGLYEWLGMKPAGVGAVDAMGNASVAAIKQTGVSLTDTVNGTAKTTETLVSKVGVEAARKLGLESTKEVMKWVGPAAWACVGIYAATSAYPMACDAKAAAFPSKKSKHETLQYEIENKRLEAKLALMNSLEKNAKGIRGSLGIPIACEDKARQLALAGGDEELEKIIKDYKKWFAECPS